jgi:hypothetical protein
MPYSGVETLTKIVTARQGRLASQIERRLVASYSGAIRDYLQGRIFQDE